LPKCAPSPAIAAHIHLKTTLNALAVEAFNDLLKKHGKRQSVENPLLD
jgi:hypothetical protein